MTTRFYVDPRHLLAMQHFVSKDVTRYGISNMLFEWTTEKLKLVGTDGHVLAIWECGHARPADCVFEGARRALVPVFRFDALLREALKRKYAMTYVQLTFDERITMQIEGKDCGETLSCSIIPSAELGDFPDYTQVMLSADQFQPIPDICINVSLMEKFRLAAGLLGVHGVVALKFRFAGEKERIEVRIGQLSEFVGLLMPMSISEGVKL